MVSNSLGRKCLVACAIVLLLAAAAPAAEQRLNLTVTGGKHDSKNAPVRLLVELPAALAEAGAASLVTASGDSLAAQVTKPGVLNQAKEAPEGSVLRELHFVVPEIKTGQTLKLVATLSTDVPAPKTAFAWKEEPKQWIELSYGAVPVLRYMCAPLDEAAREQTYKVFHHVYNPAGTRLVTKGPGGKYTHHRAIFFGFNRTSYPGGRCDIWHCSNAHQSHEGVLAQEAGPVLGRHRVAVHWHGAKKHLFLKEQRELTVYRVPGGRLIEFASRLVPVEGPVKLDGDPQHAGFQFRAHNDVAAKTARQTYYLRPSGQGKPGATLNWGGKNPDPRTVNQPWKAMSFVLGDDRYTAVYIDHPNNPKEARYSERNYGRFGSYFVHTIDDGKDLVVNYRIWLQDGETTIERCNALRADFVDPPAAAIAT